MISKIQGKEQSKVRTVSEMSWKRPGPSAETSGWRSRTWNCRSLGSPGLSVSPRKSDKIRELIRVPLNKHSLLNLREELRYLLNSP